jgi:hypothetical protein
VDLENLNIFKRFESNHMENPENIAFAIQFKHSGKYICAEGINKKKVELRPQPHVWEMFEFLEVEGGLRIKK